jgi:hypothetical protein
MNTPLILPDPACSFGYPLGQVAELLSDEERYGGFLHWWRGCGYEICDPHRPFKPSSCSIAHGPVVRPYDLCGYLEQAAA